MEEEEEEEGEAQFYSSVDCRESSSGADQGEKLGFIQKNPLKEYGGNSDFCKQSPVKRLVISLNRGQIIYTRQLK